MRPPRAIGRALARQVGAALWLAALAACSSMAPQAKGPAPARAPVTVAEALAQLDGAEAELARAMPGKLESARDEPSKAGASPTTPTGAPPQEPPEPQRMPNTAPAQKPMHSEEHHAEGVGDHDGYAPLSQDPCAIACRALASMVRAASHVCDLAGKEDTRCTEARARVERASERVHSSCPACAE